MRSDAAHRSSQTLQRALQLLDTLASRPGETSVPMAAGQIGITTSTAYRLVAELERCGMLARIGRGRYSGGIALHRLAQAGTMNAIVIATARPLLKKLSNDSGRVAHLGIFEEDMVTYLIREAPAKAEVFTREGMQLEAYCTAVGQVLLAGLSSEELERYLATGHFVALTSHTVIDPERLRDRLDQARERGFAYDNEESKAGLHCVAVPLAPVTLGRLYAISLSGTRPTAGEQEQQLAACRQTARHLAVELNRRPTGPTK